MDKTEVGRKSILEADTNLVKDAEIGEYRASLGKQLMSKEEKKVYFIISYSLWCICLKVTTNGK